MTVGGKVLEGEVVRGVDEVALNVVAVRPLLLVVLVLEDVRGWYDMAVYDIGM